MHRASYFAVIALAICSGPAAAQQTLEGTWKIISSRTTNLATGAVTDTLGPNPQGVIMYGRDGHMIVLITRADRPKPDSIQDISSRQREQLFTSMMAYAGTYTFDGKTIEHHIDLSWNEVWSHTIQVRDVKIDGDRLIYTTRPAPAPVYGDMSVATVVWEKVK